MTRAMLLATAVVSMIAAAPPADAQGRSHTGQPSPGFVAPGKDPYAGIFRYGAQRLVQPTMEASPLRDTRTTMVCGTTVFHGDPKIDPRIGAAPKLAGPASRTPTPKARLIEPKLCVQESSIGR